MTKVKLLVMDVDGTLTDGRIFIGPSGEEMKAFDVRDGYGIARILPEIGVIPVIITGRKSQIVENRSEELGIDELYQGVTDKAVQLQKVAEKYGVSLKEVAYIGDDLNDMECITSCGLTACPQDAVSEVKQAVDYICSHLGGRGAVREFIENIKKE